MNKKRFLTTCNTVAAFLLMAVLALTACKGGKTEKEAEATADDEEEMMDPDDDSFFGNYRNYFKTEEPKEVTVKTAKEFIKALKSNRHIIIPHVETLELTEAIDELVDEGELFEYDRSYSQKGVYYNDEYDGKSLILVGLKNLFIEGTAGEGAHLEVTPRYAEVIYLKDCSNVVLCNLTMGHTDAGDCTGDVVYAEGSSEIIVDKCSLYGCGVNGLQADHSESLLLLNSEFYGCSDCGIYIYSTDDVTVKGCKIYDNMSGVSVGEYCKDIIFDHCTFEDNHGQLFRCWSEIRVKNSSIEHHNGDDTDNVRFSNCDVNMDYRDSDNYADVEEDYEE